MKILALSRAAALVCASLRTAYPQIATAVALACGVAVLMLTSGDLAVLSNSLRKLDDYAGKVHNDLPLLKICAIAMLAEFASDICRDAGEAALAKRIEIGIRIGITASAFPLIIRIMQKIGGLIE